MVKVTKTVVRALISGSGGTAAVAVFLLMLVTVREVVGRYIFRAPWLYSLDASVYLLGWITFIGLAPTMREGGHVRVDIVFNALPQKWQAIFSCATSVLGLIFATVLVYQGVLVVEWSLRIGRGSLGVLDIPLYIPQILVPLGAFLLWTQLLSNVITRIKGLFPKQSTS